MKVNNTLSQLFKKTQLRKIDNKRYALDVRGLACPYPQILVMAAMDELESDDVLEVTLDNPPSVGDVPPALKKRGYKVMDVARIDSLTWKIVALNGRQ
jgi:TusA-related sulfurtransferase